MTKRFLIDSIGWGLILWLFGYAFGIILFIVMPQALFGWIIMPFGILLSLWVLYKKTKGTTLKYYLGVGVVWFIIAVVCDYFFLVRAFHPADGYYKVDVYLYYAATILLPLIVGWRKTRKKTA